MVNKYAQMAVRAVRNAAALLGGLAALGLAGSGWASADVPDGDQFVRDMIAAGFDPSADAVATFYGYCKESRLNGMPLVTLLAPATHRTQDDPRVQTVARIIQKDLCPDVKVAPDEEVTSR